MTKSKPVAVNASSNRRKSLRFASGISQQRGSPGTWATFLGAHRRYFAAVGEDGGYQPARGDLACVRDGNLIKASLVTRYSDKLRDEIEADLTTGMIWSWNKSEFDDIDHHPPPADASAKHDFGSSIAEMTSIPDVDELRERGFTVDTGPVTEVLPDVTSDRVEMKTHTFGGGQIAAYKTEEDGTKIHLEWKLDMDGELFQSFATKLNPLYDAEFHWFADTGTMMLDDSKQVGETV